MVKSGRAATQQGAHLAKAEQALQEAEKWWKTWVTWLAVGNGGGLLAVGAALLKDEYGGLTQTDLVFMGWFFLAGVGAAAGTARLRFSAFQLAAKYDLDVAFEEPIEDALERFQGELLRARTFRTSQALLERPSADRHVTPRYVALAASTILEFVSATTFVGALAMPLISIGQGI